MVASPQLPKECIEEICFFYDLYLGSHNGLDILQLDVHLKQAVSGIYNVINQNLEPDERYSENDIRDTIIEYETQRKNNRINRLQIDDDDDVYINEEVNEGADQNFDIHYLIQQRDQL